MSPWYTEINSSTPTTSYDHDIMHRSVSIQRAFATTTRTRLVGSVSLEAPSPPSSPATHIPQKDFVREPTDQPPKGSGMDPAEDAVTLKNEGKNPEQKDAEKQTGSEQDKNGGKTK
ncbi:hypothetical protein HKX48_007667 [Thoreauomyces humboldtii]|nr:hypothetical protein HKX48_007667 [Thoreauomyces humboldtii]